MPGTPIDNALLRSLLPGKGQKKIDKWLKELHDNEFETVEDLGHLDDDTWKALNLPLAVTIVLRKQVQGQLPDAKVDDTPANGLQVRTIGSNDKAPIEQLDCVVIDVSGSMRSSSKLDPDKTREDVSKMLFHTMVDKMVGLELNHSVGLLAFGKMMTAYEFTREYEKFHDELGRLDANQGATLLYDSILEAASMLLNQKKAIDEKELALNCVLRIFVLTDGCDTSSKHPAWQVTDFLQQNQIILDSIPVAGFNATLAGMSAATGGKCMQAQDQDQAMALFEREAVLHVSYREAGIEPPRINSLQALNELARTVKPITDLRSAESKVVKAAVLPTSAVAAKFKKQSKTARSPAAVKRVMKEFSDICDNPLREWTVHVSEQNTMQWKAVLSDCRESAYEDGYFCLTIEFPNDYPFKPPSVRFVTRIFHPNINNDGVICMDILKSSWSPALSISKVLLAIDSLLRSPNPDDPLVPTVAQLYRDDRAAFVAKAKEWTRLYAAPTRQAIDEQFNLI